MNNIGKYSFKSGKLILKKPVINILSLETLDQLPNDKSRYLKLYKSFYKLRHLIDKEYKHDIRYQTLVKRYFKHQQFNKRRIMILGDVPELTQNELLSRMIKTLAFVFNSTVAMDDETKPIYFFEDLNEPERVEKSILQTILEMDYQKPNSIKYDFQYIWVKELNDALDKLPSDPTVKEYRSIMKDKMDYIGFQQYEKKLMILNENYNLCL